MPQALLFVNKKPGQSRGKNFDTPRLSAADAQIPRHERLSPFQRKKPASSWERRAKFREETPVTRQNEEPNFTLLSYCNAQTLAASEICMQFV
jgi:hypothetical protein